MYYILSIILSLLISFHIYFTSSRYHNWIGISIANCPEKMVHAIYMASFLLIHWSQMMHICISKFSIIGSDNGLSPSRSQAIIQTNAGILLIRTSGANFEEIMSEICIFPFKKMHLKLPSGKMAAILSRLQWVPTIVYNMVLLSFIDIVTPVSILLKVDFANVISKTRRTMNYPAKFGHRRMYHIVPVELHFWVQRLIHILFLRLMCYIQCHVILHRDTKRFDTWLSSI